jgi:hypothetical protein
MLFSAHNYELTFKERTDIDAEFKRLSVQIHLVSKMEELLMWVQLQLARKGVTAICCLLKLFAPYLK